jgi:hypothetical protein
MEQLEQMVWAAEEADLVTLHLLKQVAQVAVEWLS